MGEGLIVKGPQVQGDGGLGKRASPLSQELLLSPKVETPSKGREVLNQISQMNAGSVWRWGI